MSRPRQDLIAIVHDGHVRTVPGSTGPQLPEGTDRDSLAVVGDVVGDPTALVLAPARQVATDPQTILHLISTNKPSTADRVSLNELGRLAHPPAVGTAIQRGVAEWSDPSIRSPNRPDWFDPGWLPRVEGWVDSKLAAIGERRAGPTEVVKVWSLSAVLRIPTCVKHPGASAVFFKAACQLFRAEPTISQLLASHAQDCVPDLVAVDADSAWMLMRPLLGLEGDDHTRRGVDAVEVLARLQLTMVDKVDALARAGAPDRTLQPTLEGLSMIINDSVELALLTADERRAARAAESQLGAEVIALAELGLPYTLSHGDLHLGNVALSGDQVVLYDWTDAAISFGVLDVPLLAEDCGEWKQAVADRYIRTWSEGYQAATVTRALELAQTVTWIYQAISYERIYRSQEPDSRWEMAGVVASILRRLSAAT